MRLFYTEKVACSVNQLEKDTRYWWEVVAQTEDVERMTWARFSVQFHEKYLGEARLCRKNTRVYELALRKDDSGRVCWQI